MHATTTSLRQTTRHIDPRWRVFDIVVSSVLGVVSALVFFAWNQVYAPVTAPLESLQPGSQALLSGIWLFAGVLGGLVIRKPGTAAARRADSESLSRRRDRGSGCGGVCARGVRQHARGGRTPCRRIGPLLERLRLGHLTDANPFTPSGGEKRPLSVATVLITRPPLLVLDEPTFGQDSRTWAELVVFLAELLDEGSSVIAVAHDAHPVEALADIELRISRAGHRIESRVS